jgi:hypothetical protein
MSKTKDAALVPLDVRSFVRSFVRLASSDGVSDSVLLVSLFSIVSVDEDEHRPIDGASIHPSIHPSTQTQQSVTLNSFVFSFF